MRRQPVVQSARGGFTLVELLVVIGIIGLLISMLLPAVQKANMAAKSVACASNLRQLGQMLFMYGDQYRGWIFPVGAWEPAAVPTPTFTGQYKSLGSNVLPHERWPMFVYQFSHPLLDPVPTYSALLGDGDYPDAEIKPWTPQVMTCPGDTEPRSAHSYIVNKLVVQNQAKFLKFGGKADGKSNVEVVIAGEKTTITSDYYMEVEIAGNAVDPLTLKTEYERVVEQARHGKDKGSNYLFFDGHVEMIGPKQGKAALDPWSITAP